MSVLIKGMEMQSNCNNCPLLQTGYMEHYCPVVKEVMQGIEIVSERHPDCPLVKVPSPHGDLIDRGDVLEEINRIFPCSSDEYERAYTLAEQADTIIKAEE